MPVEVQVFLPFSPLGARVGVRSTVRHRTRSTLDVTHSHKVILQGPQWLGCFWGIAATRSDAAAAMQKPIDRKCLTKVYLSHAPAPVYVGGPRGSPKPTWRWCWYSGAKSWADLVVWAHRPPMGVYRTALVPVLSQSHGRGWRRTFYP